MDFIEKAAMQHSGEGSGGDDFLEKVIYLKKKKRASVSQSNERLRLREEKAFQEGGTEYI